MTHQQKNLLAGFLVVSVVFLAYWLFSSSLSQIVVSPQPGSAIASDNASSSPDAFPMNTEALSSLTNVSSSALAGGQASVQSGGDATTSNLTQNITSELASQFISMPLSGQLDASSAQALASQFDFQSIGGELSQNNLGLDAPVDVTSLHVVDDSSTPALLAYGNAYGVAVLKSNVISDLLNANGTQTMIDAAMKQNDVGSLNDFLARDKQVINTLYGLSVPRAYLDFEIKNIQFFSNVEKIFSTFGNSQDDPVKTYMAFEALPDLITQWQGIQSSIIPVKD